MTLACIIKVGFSLIHAMHFAFISGGCSVPLKPSLISSAERAVFNSFCSEEGKSFSNVSAMSE